jgi:hypothetical protein
MNTKRALRIKTKILLSFAFCGLFFVCFVDSIVSNSGYNTSLSSSWSLAGSFCLLFIAFLLCWRLGSKASTTICSVPLISARQNGHPWGSFKGKLWKIRRFCTVLTCPSESTCHAVRQGVHSKCPHGSIRMSLSFSAHILHSWKVLPVNSNAAN